ncbi:hypothetical protein I6F29_31565 [Bradyrhizobium sp. NBAIM16]|nr:hypothetical protein [Bradyrhizobium sp. NBAIM16]MCA1507481.1 hypothetical protein [Bradyrhizobium sp. NBAIM02]MCA1524856.1 hypothetical protein [Bradyrhizobium yuanmingense]
MRPANRSGLRRFRESFRHTVTSAKRLPMNLLDALRALEHSSVLRDHLGEFVPAYLKLKHEEWNDYARHLTQWERDNTLDC